MTPDNSNLNEEEEKSSLNKNSAWRNRDFDNDNSEYIKNTIDDFKMKME